MIVNDHYPQADKSAHSTMTAMAAEVEGLVEEGDSEEAVDSVVVDAMVEEDITVEGEEEEEGVVLHLSLNMNGITCLHGKGERYIWKGMGLVRVANQILTQTPIYQSRWLPSQPNLMWMHRYKKSRQIRRTMSQKSPELVPPSSVPMHIPRRITMNEMQGCLRSNLQNDEYFKSTTTLLILTPMKERLNSTPTQIQAVQVPTCAL
jgi:hypothetical protein